MGWSNNNRNARLYDDDVTDPQPYSHGNPLPVYTVGVVDTDSTIADGADVTQGAKADPPATTATVDPWTEISLLKGLLKIWLDVWNSVTHAIGVTFTNTTIGVTGPLTDTQMRASAVPISLASLPALAAGSAIAGALYQISGAVVDAAGNVLTVKHSDPVNVAASTTDGAVVAAVANKKIRVLSVYAVAGGTATTLTFNTKPAGAGAAISAALANGANGGEILPHNPHGWFKDTNSGEGLSVTTGAGATTGLQVAYVEVP